MIAHVLKLSNVSILCSALTVILDPLFVCSSRMLIVCFLFFWQVEHYPYNPDYMLFMDYRDYRCRDPESVDAEEIPTFLYAMPVSSTRVFFEVGSALFLG